MQYIFSPIYGIKHHIITKKEVNKEMEVVTKYNSNISQSSTSRLLLQFYSEKPFANITDPSGAHVDFVSISTFGFSSADQNKQY